MYREVTDTKISYVIDISLIYRLTGEVKGSGTGACTTMETKYGYRWVGDPEEYNFPRQGLKRKQGKQGVVYRIPNPEWAELENTILKIARKRAEVDAAQGLPGVGTALARLFTQAGGRAKGFEPEDQWSSFWSQAKTMGLSSDEVHNLLGVNSMKEWLAQGKSLNDAIITLSQKLL